jgi:25S rRNA (cytosine2278-C5)-methyltransferase
MYNFNFKKDYDLIEEIIKETKILEKHKKYERSKFLIMVLIYELLLGKNKGNESKKKFAEMRNKTYNITTSHYKEIKSCFNKIKTSKGIKKNEELMNTEEINKPAERKTKYIRVNTLNSTEEEVLTEFEKMKVTGKDLVKDEHIPNLFLLKKNVDLHKSKLLQKGMIVIQDKASCFPAFLLSNVVDELNISGNIIDTCAAPGNKTCIFNFNYIFKLI